MTKDEQRQTAYERIFGEYYHDLPPMEDTTFPKSFDAGFAAAERPWHRIKTTEDLPKYNGRYITQFWQGTQRVEEYNSHRIDYWLKDVVAWQELPNPFAESVSLVGNPDRVKKK